jgi:hypothetical protein
MAIACPVDLNTSALRCEISRIYVQVALAHDGEFHFFRRLSYPDVLLG